MVVLDFYSYEESRWWKNDVNQSPSSTSAFAKLSGLSLISFSRLDLRSLAPTNIQSNVVG